MFESQLVWLNSADSSLEIAKNIGFITVQKSVHSGISIYGNIDLSHLEFWAMCIHIKWSLFFMMHWSIKLLDHAKRNETKIPLCTS